MSDNGEHGNSKYKAEYAEKAYKLCLLSATDQQLADFFEVSVSTLNLWKEKHPKFSESLKAGKEEADAKVADSLYNRALGYSHQDTHISNYQGEITKTEIIKHYPPDPTSAIFWLKNRQRQHWTDRKEVTGADGSPLIPDEMNTLEMARRIAYELQKANKELDDATNDEG